MANNILVPFDMIYDTEMGLIKLISDKYMDPEEFEDGLIIQPDGINKQFLRIRADKNPLSEYTIKEEDANYYYKEFMTKRYDEILDRSPTTGIYDAVLKFTRDSTGISVNILCKDTKEVDKIEKDFGENNPFECILLENYEDIDIRQYDTFYVKDIEELLLYGKKFDGKNVYMASYMHNFTFGLEEPVPDVRVVTLILDKADLYVIDMYPEDDYIISVG